jgi:hypothetical protein
MARMTTNSPKSQACVAMDEAIELNINEQPSPYPNRATFVDADGSNLGEEIASTDAGQALVVCYSDGTCRILDIGTHTVGETG